jgi:hypothetical protein
MKRGLAIGIIVAVAVVVGVGAFFGGRATGGGAPTPQEALKVLQNLTQEQRAQLLQNGGLGSLFGNRTGPSGGQGNPAGGFTAGSIINKDATTITVKLQDGSTKLILYSGSTTIGQFTTGSANDLTTGKDITVTGTANSDGSITATRIQIGTLGGSGGGFPGGPPNGGTQAGGQTGGQAGGGRPGGTGTAPSGASPASTTAGTAN